MTKDDVKGILVEVRANIARLDGCPGPHAFTESEQKTGALVTQWRCTSCLGTVSTSDKRWYERGLAHARHA